VLHDESRNSELQASDSPQFTMLTRTSSIQEVVFGYLNSDLAWTEEVVDLLPL
jgi:hypothetical protein